MDSGNSGSMQSSSGDEEYDSTSRPPSFLNPSTHFVSLSSTTNPHNNTHPSHLLPQHHQLSFFDPSPNLFHSFSQSPSNPINSNSLLNLDSVRSRSATTRSNLPDCTDLGITNTQQLPPPSNSYSAAAAAAASSSQSILGASSSMQLRSVQDNGIRSSPPPDQGHHVVSTRNPKKRTRASRRAPTTVLTTDTSNFRAMVQEFTGIPAPPFSAPSPYARRLELFGSGLRSTHLEPMGSLYPLRPSPQKPHQPSPFPFSSSSSSPSNVNVEATNSNNNSTVNLAIPASNISNNYQQQPQNMLNMQNQMLSFQSLLQPQQPPNILQSSVNVSGLGAKSSLPSSLEDLGMSSHIGITSHGGGATADVRVMRNNYQDHLRSLDSCKLNYSASSSEFHHSHDKGLENVPSRGEGTVDSWICPSE